MNYLKAVTAKKKVVREEPFGFSGAIKVIYDDGTFGLRANPGEPEPAGPSADELLGEIEASTGDDKLKAYELWIQKQKR